LAASGFEGTLYNHAIRPGDTQFWHIGNIGADLFLKLKLEGTPMYVVATDGHTLVRPHRAADILLGPGQRVEVVVVGPTSGCYAFRSVPRESRAASTAPAMPPKRRHQSSSERRTARRTSACSSVYLPGQ
jgi:FtsP/CotA-like multicopper oxidase with cupredoxin domain